LGFLCGVTILAGVVFGLAPAFAASQRQAGVTLREESRASASGSRKRLRQALVVLEIAVSLILLTGAGLMIRSLNALLHRDPGFDARNLLTFDVNLPETTYPDDAAVIRFDDQFGARARSLPGIGGIANVSVVPLSGNGGSIRFVTEGHPTENGREDEADIREVSPGYFPMMKIPLLAGRLFHDVEDAPKAPRHVIVNQAWVDRYLRGENPLGKRVRFTYSPKQPFREIVGVVGNNADAGLDTPAEPTLFLPFQQDANSYISYIVRAGGSPVAAIGAIRGALREVDPRLVLRNPLTMEQVIDQSPAVFLRRYPSYLIGSFAVLAIVLAMIGLYGLISYSVSQRGRELSIRIALGAQRGDVLRLVMGEGAWLASIGVAIGVAAGLALTQLMRGLLFGVAAGDPATFGGVAMAVALVALAASLIPARRAMRTDPVAALRYE
jgi:predicted permease